jgi:hypothetical protein
LFTGRGRTASRQGDTRDQGVKFASVGGPTRRLA